MSRGNNHTWVNPIVPDEDDRCRYLRYKFENGQLLRQLNITDGSDNLLYVLAFQEEEDVDPQIGDEALRIDYTVVNSTQNSVACSLVTVTQEMLDGTIPQVNVAPTDIALTNFNMPEASGIGDTVGILSTFDPNIGDTHTYTIILDVDDKFVISSDQLRLKNLLDFDVAAMHDVTIRTTDQGGLTFDKIFTIFVQEQVGFINDKATQFIGDTIPGDMVGPAASTILPSNGSFSLVANILKDDPLPFDSLETKFNGSTQFLSAPFDASFAGLTELSMDGWVTLDTLTGEKCIASHFGAAGARGFRFSVLSGKLYINVSENGSVQESFSGTTNLAIDTRYHVAFAFDGTNNTIKTWINGVIETNTVTGINSIHDPNIPLRIGARGDSSFPETSFLGGLIDEVCLHNEALVTADILAKYNSGTALDVRDLPSASSLVSFWRMGEYDTAPTIQDVVGPNDLTMNNMTQSDIVLLGGDPVPTSDIPLSVSGLQLWLDADDSTTITDVAGAVSQWDDKSGNGYDVTQATEASKPTLVTSGYGDRTTMGFDGVDDYLNTTMPGILDEMTIFIVSKYNNLNQPAANFDYLYSFGTNSGNNLMSLARRSAGANADEYYLYDGGTTLNGPVLVGQQFQTHTQRISSTAVFHEYFLDGVSQTVIDNDVAFNIENNFDLGRYLTGTHYLDGEVAEVLIYNRTLTNTERELIEDYLETKWVDGVDPSVHPDKSIISIGDVAKITWDQRDTIKFKYLDGAVPKEIVATDITYPNGEYHNIVARYDVLAQTVDLAIDGIVKGSTGSVTLPSRDGTLVRVGSDEDQLEFLDATVDEVSIFSAHIDIIQIYNGGLAQDLLENASLPDPELWLRMGDPADDYLTPNGILDRSGNNFHFTANNMSSSNCVNDALPTASPYSDTLSLPFNGIDQYVQLPSGVGQFAVTDAFSISTWLKYETGDGTSTATIVGTMAGQVGTSNYSGYRLRNSATRKPCIQFISSVGAVNAQKTVQATNSLLENVWYNIVATNDGTNTIAGMKIYVNGVSVPLDTIQNQVFNASTLSPEAVILGARVDRNPTGATQIFKGIQNEISIWNKELNLAEVQEIYNSGVPSDLSEHSALADLAAWLGCGDVDGDDETKLVDRLSLILDSVMINFNPNPFSTDVP